MIFKCNILQYEHELRDILRMFVPFFTVPKDINFYYSQGEGGMSECEVKIGEKTYQYAFLSAELPEKQLKKELKKRLYLALEQHFGFGLPWGSLTGIRPTKIAYKLLAHGEKIEDIPHLMQDDYYVSPKKAQLTAEIIKNQTDFLQSFFQIDSIPPQNNAKDSVQSNSANNAQNNAKDTDFLKALDRRLSDCVNLYIHIPFCPTRCSYCSFVSLPREKNEELIKDYIKLLCRDIEQTAALIKEQNKKILSVYIGGGTPTVLDKKELKALLCAVNGAGLLRGTEYTVEAGRPDTITKDKLEVLKEYGVTRVCVNPQSFNDKTLSVIGRSHTAQDIYAAFDICRKLGFDINMDLIAGLPGESLADFKSSLNCALSLSPENITVHTLSLKKGSKMSERLIIAGENPLKTGENIESMTDLAYKKLKDASYLPYYLYRQKDMAQSLENTGYCLKDKQSVNNITVMEESVAVYACGAGAISKRIGSNGITRLAELRDVGLYIKEFDERLRRKLKFLG